MCAYTCVRESRQGCHVFVHVCKREQAGGGLCVNTFGACVALTHPFTKENPTTVSGETEKDNEAITKGNDCVHTKAQLPFVSLGSHIQNMPVMVSPPRLIRVRLC